MKSTQIIPRIRLDQREQWLSPYAVRSSDGRRQIHEQPCEMRGEFQRDRDRIIHSNAFRRLKHKTQVFIAPSGDHYVTRLTHTLEVSQIARTISRALNLNEDLTEAICLGHDLGHTPFGHVGEAELDKLYPDGFRHADQSLRLVEVLEKQGEGLNLTKDVRDGIVSHSKPQGDFLGDKIPDGLSLEGQVCRISDAVAYLNHDLADAFRAGILNKTDLPNQAMDILGTKHSDRINTMVTDIVRQSWGVSGQDGMVQTSRPMISMGSEVREAVNTLRDFMFANVYLPEDVGDEGETARKVIRLLYTYFDKNRQDIPSEYGVGRRAVVDYVASMTDLYALRIADNIESGISGNLGRF